jgi:hypothetical protein
MPHQEEHVPNPQLQHLSALKPAAAFSQASSCVSWVLLQEATGVKLVKRVIYRTIRLAKLSSVVETWGGWHLFKAQAVRSYQGCEGVALCYAVVTQAHHSECAMFAPPSQSALMPCENCAAAMTGTVCVCHRQQLGCFD